VTGTGAHAPIRAPAAGANYDWEVSEIDGCAAFVVVMTPDSDDSTWVDRELNRAEARHKPVLPLLLAGDVFFRLSDLQCEDVRGAGMPGPGYLARLAGLAAPAVVPGRSDEPADPGIVAGIRPVVRVEQPPGNDGTPTAAMIGLLVQRLDEELDENFFVLGEAGDAGRFFQAVRDGATYQVEYREGAGSTQWTAVTVDRGAVLRAALGWARGVSGWPAEIPQWTEFGSDVHNG
jgi:hypothetical protein